MSWAKHFSRGGPGAIVGVALTGLVGVALGLSRMGEGLDRLSYDLPFAFAPATSLDEVVILSMDEQSHQKLEQPWGQVWNRNLHTALLERLTRDQAKLVVFDVFFGDDGPDPAQDRELAAAMRKNGKVILAAQLEPVKHPWVKGQEVVMPRQQFAEAARAWGLSALSLDSDFVPRLHFNGREECPPLSWMAASVIEPSLASSSHQQERWVRYYGRARTIPTLSYYAALDQGAGYYKDKIVFIGGQPHAKPMGQRETEQYSTPYTRWSGDFTSGVEIQATMFLNLLRGEFLTRLSPIAEVWLLLACAVALGGSLPLLRPLIATIVGIGAAVGISSFGMWLVWHHLVWFPWMTVVACQLPCALFWTLVWDRQSVRVRTPEAALASTVTARDRSADVSAPANTTIGTEEVRSAAHVFHSDRTLTVPDHELLRPVGRGAYGEVWIARNAIGLYHAAKIMHRHEFRSAEPYEREFRGMKHYMPISLNHPGLVHVLHVGRNDAAGFFYYVMELGDDEVSGPQIFPEKYAPKNLSRELHLRKRLCVEECVRLFLPLADALAYLHNQRLIHRDIKPSNIIYVRGVPKLADIGLVTEARTSVGDSSFVGTAGYIPPEGPGTPAGDVYSLGKVIYETCLGRDRREYPLFPEDGSSEPANLGAIREVISRACAPRIEDRFRNAAELHAALVKVQTFLGSPAPA